MARLQRLLLLQIDEVIDPDNPALADQRKSLVYEIQQSLKPPRFVGKNNDWERIRSNYVGNKIALQLEHLPVTDQTPSLDFWQYVDALEKKYKAQQPQPQHEPVE
ncbi:hypothetical protein [Spirosoma sordidisoli]|uniref:Uncharacterized protein n=1 Tax=Spirosoma sordidisoli TaxID=2502893 RepID=A0A4Q2USK3_9BACT|nr:hypothetical protein [Spirosoma sordidisoli]RYC70861.1 hypothetical protein EQG79_01535 [Spirosoma sordidisoli]